MRDSIEPLEEQKEERARKRVTQLLAPCFDRMTTHKHALISQEKLDEAVIKAAIQDILGLEETPNLAFVSRSRQMTKQWWIIGCIFRHTVYTRFRNMFFDLLCFWTSFLLGDDPDQEARLQRLVRALPYLVVLGQKKDDPNTWYIICA